MKERNFYNQKINPFTIGVIIFFVFCLVIISISVFYINNDDSLSTGGFPPESKVSNKSLLLQKTEISTEFQTRIIQHLNVLSVLYPEITEFNIEESSITENSDNNISFFLVSDTHKTFHILINDTKIEIKNSNNESIYAATLINNTITMRSPYVLVDYFPYKDVLSNGASFEAELEESIKITVRSCVKDEYKTEAIEKTKEYIKNLKSDPSFFDYQVSTFCF